MNRHKNYWSVMGYESPSEKEAEQISAERKARWDEDKKIIKGIMDRNTTMAESGFVYVANLIKEIMEESK